MKRIVGMIATVMIIHGSIDGMYTTVDTGQQIRAVQDKFANVHFSFDKEKFESKLNPEISGKMIKLLNDSLEGDDGDLESCSERIHSGLLDNKSIFTDSSIDIKQREQFIYDISMQILKKSIEGLLPAEASIIALKNILVYCKPEAKEIGLFDMRVTISSIFIQIQYERSLHESL